MSCFPDGIPCIFLLRLTALVLVTRQTFADTGCSSGPCIVSLTGADPSAITSFTSSSYTPLLSAVGCRNNITITFQINKTLSQTPLSISFCQRQSTGLCLDKGTGGGDDWIKSEDFARICCSMHPKDRDQAASTLLGKPLSSMTRCKGYGANGYYDIYTCATLVTTQYAIDSAYDTLAAVTLVPPFGSDLANSGRTELCFQVLDSQRTSRPPTCLKIQVASPHPPDMKVKIVKQPRSLVSRIRAVNPRRRARLETIRRVQRGAASLARASSREPRDRPLRTSKRAPKSIRPNSRVRP